jgi:catechol 2,3-dioxygenase-like lactoylglutathione lyase family enzyme
MTAFVSLLGGERVYEAPDFAVFRLEDGDKVEVFGPAARGHEHFTTGPVAGFLVDDVPAAQAELEAAGIEFFGPPETASDGYAWSHFRGPDGNVYELTSGPYGG